MLFVHLFVHTTRTKSCRFRFDVTVKPSREEVKTLRRNSFLKNNLKQHENTIDWFQFGKKYKERLTYSFIYLLNPLIMRTSKNISG